MLNKVELKNNRGYNYIAYSGRDFGGTTDLMNYDKGKHIVTVANDLMNSKFRTIEFNVPIKNGEVKKIKAYRIGDSDFVIHRNVKYNSAWNLSHYGTGILLDTGMYSQRQDALDRIVDVLDMLYENKDRLNEFRTINF